jgi:GH35 family endo-1,4-beta-xylanase
MSFLKLHYCLIVTLVAVTPLTSIAVAKPQSPQKPPEGGTHVIAPNSLAPNKLNVSARGSQFASHSVTERATDDGAAAINVKVLAQPKNTWDISINQITSAPVRKEDALVASFWVRGTADSGDAGAVTEFVFEKRGDPFTKSIQYLIETPADNSWRHYWVAFKSLESYDAGGATLTFQMGYIKQEIEIAKIELWNFGEASLEDLPHTPLSYVGRATNAQWRKDALDRIEKIRKADLQLTFVDGEGKPLANQSVRVKLDRHAFGFGTAVNSWRVVGGDEDAEKYRTTLKENFNLTTMENGFKWTFWDEKPEYHQQTIDTMNWIKENDIEFRGHVMVWPGQGHLPSRIRALKDQPEQLKKELSARITEMGNLTKDVATQWDVMNEGFDNHDLMDWLGDDAMVQWFKETDAVLPDCDLYYNDYAALARGGHPTGHKEHFEKTIKYLIDNGAPIDGIGIQGHFGSLLTPPHRILKGLDRWGSFKKKIMITEFDVIVPDEQLRADFLRDFFISCFSHQAVEGIVVWGFWAPTHWMPDSAFYDDDWNLTKTGQQWKTLMQQWQTDETLTTDSAGVVKLRGFIGDYKIDIGGKTFDVMLPKNGAQAEIVP